MPPAHATQTRRGGTRQLICAPKSKVKRGGVTVVGRVGWAWGRGGGMHAAQAHRWSARGRGLAVRSFCMEHVGMFGAWLSASHNKNNEKETQVGSAPKRVSEIGLLSTALFIAGWG